MGSVNNFNARRIANAVCKTVCWCSLLVWLLACMVGAKNIDSGKLANAIYRAEGGTKTKYPYGIFKKYKYTTPRRACINTIDHAKRDWDGKGDFIEFLGSRYAPIGAKNDPTNLNKNWVKNVKYFYGTNAKELKNGRD